VTWGHALPLVVLILVLVTRDALPGERLTYDELVERLLSLKRLAEPVVPGERTGASTSHDRASSFDAATGAYGTGPRTMTAAAASAARAAGK
jgi:hypothetical protein